MSDTTSRALCYGKPSFIHIRKLLIEACTKGSHSRSERKMRGYCGENEQTWKEKAKCEKLPLERIVVKMTTCYRQ